MRVLQHHFSTLFLIILTTIIPRLTCSLKRRVEHVRVDLDDAMREALARANLSLIPPLPTTPPNFLPQPFIALSPKDFNYNPQALLASEANPNCVDASTRKTPLWSTKDGNIIFGGDTIVHIKGLNW